MFKFIKELIGAVKEGIAEGQAEYETEKKAKQKASSEAIAKAREQVAPTIENASIALSCPFRSVLTTGDDMRLIEFGWLSESEKKDFRKVLKRDFGLEQADDVSRVIYTIEEAYSDEESLERSVFLAGLNLYILTSVVEVGYQSFSEVENHCRKLIDKICNDAHVESWQHFASLFMEGECINNAVGRKFLNKNIKSLLENESSPWRVFSWEKIVRAFGTDAMSSGI